MHAQLDIYISITKSAYNYEESTIFYDNYITQSASYGHGTFIVSRSCQNRVGLG